MSGGGEISNSAPCKTSPLTVEPLNRQPRPSIYDADVFVSIVFPVTIDIEIYQ